MRMLQVFNGMPAQWLTMASWRKSRHSNPSGSCLEVAGLPEAEIAVRNSRHPGGPALIFTVEEMAAFVQGAKDGEFDDLLGSTGMARQSEDVRLRPSA